MPPLSQASPATRFFAKLFASFTLLLFVVYSVDFTWYHLRLAVPKLGAPISSVHRVRLLAIPDKGNKTDYEIDAIHPEEDVPCTHTLFPHSNDKPCWYVIRHANDPIAM